MVLNELDFLKIEMNFKNIHEDPQARKELIEGGGKSMVPCLRIENDKKTTWMYESRDIIKYLREHA